MYPVITNTVVLDALVCVALITFANVLVKRFFAKKLDYNVRGVPPTLALPNRLLMNWLNLTLFNNILTSG